MKRLATFLGIFSVLLFLITTGCKKEGCTDPSSKNYDPSANVNDGSCQYEGSIVFWYDKTTAENLQKYDVQSITIYFDNKIIGSYATNVYFTSIPKCSQQATVGTTVDLGNSKSKSFPFKVIDDDGYTLWEGQINIEANSCLRYELRYHKSKIAKELTK